MILGTRDGTLSRRDLLEHFAAAPALAPDLVDGAPDLDPLTGVP